jgi:hypothetical protein
MWVTPHKLDIWVKMLIFALNIWLAFIADFIHILRWLDKYIFLGWLHVYWTNYASGLLRLHVLVNRRYKNAPLQISQTKSTIVFKKNWPIVKPHWYRNGTRERRKQSHLCSLISRCQPDHHEFWLAPPYGRTGAVLCNETLTHSSPRANSTSTL